MTFTRSEIVGYGSFLPSKVLTNDDLSKIVETSDEWISERTGIKTRHIVGDELTSDMAVEASKEALAVAGLTAKDIDVVIVATITTDLLTPSTAIFVANKLGVKAGIPAFDISAACTGFVYGLTMADNMIRLGQAKTALVIGAESLSKVTDWKDRNTCVLFGDGAGAVVLKASKGKGTIEDTGVLATKLYSDANHIESLKSTGGPAATQSCGVLWMNGKEVFKFAIGALAQAAEDVAKELNIKVEDVDWLVPHQANIRIIEGVGKKLGLPKEKVIVTVAHQGNTSAASIPLALAENIKSGKIKKGDLIIVNGMGAGFTWGGALIRL